MLAGDAAELLRRRFVADLDSAHGADALVKFEELLEAAIDLDAVPEKYLIDAGYDPQLQVRLWPLWMGFWVTAT